jgi:hypothetical protein
MKARPTFGSTPNGAGLFSFYTIGERVMDAQPHEIYRIRLRVGDECVIYRTTHGKSAALLFTRFEQAELFLRSKNLEAGHFVEEMSQAFAVDWIRGLLSRGEASQIAVNPSPEASQTAVSVVDSFDFLMMLEGKSP